MEWLNYHHLLYFWTAAQEGGISRAAEKLRLSQPTISVQIRQLEEVLGAPLFHRQGRRLTLTDTGQIAFRYAEEIFGAGRELLETLRGRPAGRPLQLTVGIANAVPKLVVYRMLEPLLQPGSGVHLVCREDNAAELVSRLAIHALDVVISDAPAPPEVRAKVFNHMLGESATAFFAPPKLAAGLRRRFPRCLAEAPLLLPSANTALRRALDAWFEREELQPQVVAEFEDSALMKVCGHGAGCVFPAPAAIEKDVCRFYGVRPIGRTDGVKEQYYAISAERRVKHPGVLAIANSAHEALFR